MELVEQPLTGRLATFNGDPVGTPTWKSVITVLSNKILTVSPAKLWLENEDMASISDDFLQARASAPEVFLC